jgi:hypothetical protein
VAAASSADTSSATFALKIEPRGDDRLTVDVWVEAADPQAWKNLPASPDDPRWESLIVLRRVDSAAEHTNMADASAQPGLLGSCALVERRLRFRPRFPLLPGETYKARFSPAALMHSENVAAKPPIVATYRVDDETPASVPEVVEVHPSGDQLPANHLKFYLLFSEPMRQGRIWDFFTLVDETTGEPVHDPLRHTELWSEDGRQLTLWFHPGRQKTGVNLNVEIGPILEPGRRYTLSISPRWLSQKGTPLAAEFRKSFAAVEPDHTQPRLADWTFRVPSAGTRDPLEIEFPEPLDWALLQKQLAVEAASGARAPGEIRVGAEERSWQLHPSEPWQPGGYRLKAGGVLEDLAGNSLARPFEVDLTDSSASRPRAEFSHAFEITPREAQP